MSVVTKGPRIIKSIRKKLFPLEIKKGPGAEEKIGTDDINIHARIVRTKRYRNIKATQLREARKGKK